MLQKNKTKDDVWVFRHYEGAEGKRVYRKQQIGSVREYPRRRDAEKAVLDLVTQINAQVRSPKTVRELATHYAKNELTPERKAFATRETHQVVLNHHILPHWGDYKLTDVRTVQVEKWLDALPHAPATKTKIKSVFSVLYSHAIRYEWLTFNPISKVRASQKPLREKDTLTPEEFRALLGELSVRDRALVLLAGSTAMRRSEMIALAWKDLNAVTMTVLIKKSCYRNRMGEPKTQASRRPVTLHPLVLNALLEWQKESPYNQDDDYIFASLRLNGEKPLSPDSILKKSIRPAVQRAGIRGKIVGFHTFRHSVATHLRTIGVDLKGRQDFLRHASPRVTDGVYTHVVAGENREAADKLMNLLLPEQAKALSTQQHPNQS